jgi:hypothetical protein
MSTIAETEVAARERCRARHEMVFPHGTEFRRAFMAGSARII